MVMSSCNKTQSGQTSTQITPVCDGSSPTYDSYVKSVMTSECISCHGPNSNDGDYSTYELLSSSVLDGTFTKEVMTNQTMPTASPLDEATLNKLQCWIENGHPEN